jgi:hypothetical protein
LLNPANAREPLDNAVQAIKEFLKLQTRGEIEAHYCEANGRGLFISLKGEREERYELFKLRDDLPLPERMLPDLFTHAELMKLQIPSPVPIVQDLIHAGETALLAGRPKCGKSLFTEQMALAIESGSDFLGMRVPSRKRVLMIDLENHVPALRDRFKRMGGAAPGLTIWCSNFATGNVIAHSEMGMKTLKALVLQIGAEVLFVDPWRLFLGGDENDAETTVKGLMALGALREANPGLAIVIVHHLRKEKFESPRNLIADPGLWVDAVSGHHALPSHVDAYFGLVRERDLNGEERIIFGGAARNTAPRTILLEHDEETLSFSVKRQEEALQILLTDAEKDIWSSAVGLGQFRHHELKTRADTKNNKAISSTLRKAEAQGFLRKDGLIYQVVGAE